MPVSGNALGLAMFITCGLIAAAGGFLLRLSNPIVMMSIGLSLAAVVGDPILQAFGAAGLEDAGAFPLLVAGASLCGLLVMPLVNGISRAIETRADTYAFNLLGDGRPFAAAMRRLADQNLAEERPPRWAELLLYTHPPIYRRVERAEAAHHA